MFIELLLLDDAVSLRFLFLAIIIAGIQIAIAVLGNFNGGRLEQYVPCVLEEYDIINRTLLDNSTFPVS